MRSLSLRLQIFLLVALSVLAVAATSLRSTWTFLTQDKIASLRELQTLTLVSSIQELKQQSQSLRDDLRSLAVEHYRSPERLGETLTNVPSMKGSYTWSQIRLTRVDEIQDVPLESSVVPATPKSLLFDVQDLVSAPSVKSTSSAIQPAHWSYQLASGASGEELVIEDPLTLGASGGRYLLTGKLSADVLDTVLKKIQFQSIDVQLYRALAQGSELSLVRGDSGKSEIYRQRLQEEFASTHAAEVEGRSISVKHDDTQSFVSFSKLDLPGGGSNLVLAFVSEEAKLVAEFRAFLVSQVFSMLVLLCGALLGGYFVTQLITRPVADLVDASQELEKGNFHNRVKVSARNEIGRLATAFNHLGQTLQDREVALASAESNMRQLSFQAAVFKRLTDFSERLSKVVDVDDLQKVLMSSWSQLLDIGEAQNSMGFYRFDQEQKKYHRVAELGNSSELPDEWDLELWQEDQEFGSSTFTISEALYRLPILGSGKVFGVLVFSAHEVQEAAHFEMLIVECQKMLSLSFEAANRYSQLRESSIRDGLTGLFNVRHFKECFEKELLLAQASGQELSFLFFDVDHFKKYNDTHGHPAGDRVLKQMAALMRAGFDPKQVVARYGGEEFVVLLKATGHADALMRAEYFRELVEATPFENEHTQPLGKVTISIGVSTFPDHGGDMTTLIKMADDALYQAKKTARNLVVSADALETKSVA
jgi:diguanylate cyclase (GGDEF)-like protein